MTAVRWIQCSLVCAVLGISAAEPASAGIFVGVGPVAVGVGHNPGYYGHGYPGYGYGHGYGYSVGVGVGCYMPFDPAPVHHGHYRPYLSPEYGYYAPAAPYYAPYGAAHGYGEPGCTTCGP